MPLSVLILAAGEGKRMQSRLPKVLQPLAGRPMLAHVLDTARALQADAIRVVHGHGSKALREAFPDSDLIWCHQAQQLGTGDAARAGLDDVPDDHLVLILCGDVPLIEPAMLRQLCDSVPPEGIALATARLEDSAGYGRVVRSAAGEIERIVEQRDATPAEQRISEINTGILALGASNLRQWLASLDNDNAQGEFYLTDVIASAVAAGRKVHGMVVPSALEFLGVNNRAQLAVAERTLQRRQAAALLEQGVTLADPERLDIRGRLTVGRDVFLDVGVVIEGNVALGNDVHIGPGCIISNSRLDDGCNVQAYTVIDGAVIGPHCELGPFARIRPGTQLATHAKAGNFVEIKNSTVGEASKVNHLTYIGDADVGLGVNVGAGTVTCNYDGANKHRTTIGDNAFIGSGSMLVAPVTVGAGATIGAGSTLSKSAPAGKLTLARPRQVTIDGWQRPTKKTKTSN